MKLSIYCRYSNCKFYKNFQVPVYGAPSGTEFYGQNDEPLQFGAATADGNQAVEQMDSSYVGQPIPTQGEVDQTISQAQQMEASSAEIVHPPETYHQAETYHPPETYASSTGWAGDGEGDQQEAGQEGTEGAYQSEGAPAVESGSTATPGGEDKKKKKKEKVILSIGLF